MLAGKKANTILYLKGLGILLAALIILVMFNFATQASEGELIRKNYFARDIALTITAVGASPGNTTYVYQHDDLADYEIIIKKSAEDEVQDVIVGDSKGRERYGFGIFEEITFSIPEDLQDGTARGDTLILRKEYRTLSIERE